MPMVGEQASGFPSVKLFSPERSNGCFPAKIKQTIGLCVSYHPFTVLHETSVIHGFVGVGVKLSCQGRLIPTVTDAIVNP